MTKNHRMMIMLALLPMAACSSQTPPPPIMNAPPPLSSVDQTFLMTAAATDADEMQAAQLAQTKARNPRVRTFAAKMLTDHGASSQKLAALAQSKNVTVAATPDDKGVQLATKLQADRPRAFDHDYIEAQIAGHMEAVNAYQAEIDGGQDPDVKAFATATLPTIKQHLVLAQRLGGHRPAAS